jgi:uncharacterized protein YcbX
VRLAAIVVYPVKSCRGVALERASVRREGLALDRRWMIVDARGAFVTQREAPRLALVDTAIEDDGFVLSASGAGAVRLPRVLSDGARTRVIVWGDAVEAIAHDEASRWASAWLEQDVRVVSMPDDALRPVSAKHAREGDVVSFADGFPLLVASTSSLDDLGARIAAGGGAPVPMARFRPNVVIEGAEAWAEDRWERIAIGGVVLRAPKPCERCVITTIDPATATTEREPLRTLATFRRTARGVLFGVNLVPETLGTLAVGDAVRVLDTHAPPAFVT